MLTERSSEFLLRADHLMTLLAADDELWLQEWALLIKRRDLNERIKQAITKSGTFVPLFNGLPVLLSNSLATQSSLASSSGNHVGVVLSYSEVREKRILQGLFIRVCGGKNEAK